MAGRPQRFVYYRVRLADLARAEAAAKAMQAECEARWPALHARLMWRVEDRPGAVEGDVTLMEVYEGLPSSQAAAELERLARERLAPWLAGERHVEDFEPCA